MTGVPEIEFADAHGHTDFATFVGRARRAQPEGAVRLQRVGGLLVVTAAVLEGTGLMGEGAILGLRVVPVVEGPPVDVVVSFTSIADRLARTGVTTLSIPPSTVHTAWAALSPPRAGWEPVGVLDGEAVERIAVEGISGIATGSPEGAGGHAVAALRQRVWGTMSDTAPPIVAGLAFGAHVLGFAGPGVAAQVAANGRWTRLSTPRGHVVAR